MKNPMFMEEVKEEPERAAAKELSEEEEEKKRGHDVMETKTIHSLTNQSKFKVGRLVI